MENRRAEKGVVRGRQFEIEVDGRKIPAYEGETIGAALTAAGVRTLRRTAKHHHPRGMYCGIGLCYECAMVINGVPNTRVCQTLATPGCRVETQDGLGQWEGER
ncbi:MAG TPA: (2Fe-2S)-binding protein [Steroidobacteraceae bacterium]|nr:(2Fe-2S)-binding protein [Steroidobacteraceae bacterium]